MSQPSLRILSVEDLNNNKLIVKSNNLIEASYRLSTQEQRIILFVSSMIKPEDEDFQEYHIEVKSFMDIIGVTGHSKYKETKDITKKLREKTLIIKNLEEDSETQVGWVSSFKYFNKEGFVRVRLDPELKPYFLKLKERFTKYQLKNVIRLKSSYSIRIYELLKQYEKIKERYFSLSDFKRALGIKPSEYKLYGHLKDKVIKKAKKELPQKTDLRFDFKEKKKGRKVEGLYFFIKKNNLKEQKEDEKLSTEIENLNIELYSKLQNYFCLSSNQAKKALKIRTETELLDNLDYVEKQYKTRKGTDKEIKNLGPYTWEIIQKNIKSQLSLFDVEDKKEKEKKRKKDRDQKRKEDQERAYESYKVTCIENYKETAPTDEIEALEHEIREKLRKEKTKTIGLDIFTRLAVEKEISKRAKIPTFEEWQNSNAKNV